jgi:4,5:9,10-diseco-3-hydroxy-5,9,17-trioxoandrosta-1(10),2-diene-4-oate hydrolase
VATYAAATLEVLDELGVERAPLVALSGGGPVALTLALEQPERVSRLVLVDAAGLGREVSWSYRLTILPLAPALFRRGLTAGRIEAFGRRLLYDRERLPERWVERRQAIWATDGAVEAFFSTARRSLTLRGQRVTFEGRLHEVRQPTLIVWGREDPIIPVRHGIGAAQRIPKARLHVFERCGHVPPWEYPDEFVRVVKEFLEEG